mmetsp:Transcript_28934/g.25554  ORF Transcript_28934/g.25554 Transcript_28934/m.25554 type:complete len:93 (+) Transcript_28934:1-279(+)
MKREARREILDEFRDKNKGFDVLLISSKCVSVGLNLQCANHIIFLDPQTNVSLDKQAIGRCWRLGQTKKVNVYRLITKGTIEEDTIKNNRLK